MTNKLLMKFTKKYFIVLTSVHHTTQIFFAPPLSTQLALLTRFVQDFAIEIK